MLQPKNTGWLNGQQNKTQLHAASKGLTSELKTQAEKEGIKKDIPCKWKQNKRWGRNTYINKIDFKTLE